VIWLPHRRQHGELAGIFLVATGAVLFLTELFRDPIGRGALLQGMLKGPQAGGILLVLGGAALLWERPSQRIALAPAPDNTTLPNSAEVERPSDG
jgi:prolipoprotein diacylglyceryltransferase